MKGGIWTNVEDELLKSAVMKYGMNQWARCSSLLPKKTAHQCKARWFEWLDPSIKKTEWSREEEEKLLHLAKLLPTQWRTIAPIVGRTAAQCLEHYEKMLDAAQGEEEGYDRRDDPRRLRPGEIDPNPEVKPARPDPVDMDEESKEMLQEARARLANTRGKKAKRKAREKQMEEARRLAALREKRELKAAGIEVRAKRKRKFKGIDYSVEIPFQKLAPDGFYDPTADPAPSAGEKGRRPGRLLSQMSEKRRDLAEEERRRADKRKQEAKKQQNLPELLMQINKLNDPELVRRYVKLVLPTPQVTDDELEDIARLGSDTQQLLEQQRQQQQQAGGSSAVTRSLLPAFRGTPTPVSMGVAQRTPARTPARADPLLREAQDLLAMSRAQTPLKGGENTPLHFTDFGGATPRSSAPQTPNQLLLAARTPQQKRGGSTPAGSQTPVRDSMSINSKQSGGGPLSMVDLDELEPQRQQLKLGLASLPAPSNEYQLVLPDSGAADEQDDDDDHDEEMLDGSAAVVEDAAEVKRRLQAEQERAERARFAARSQVLRGELPRPFQVEQPAAAPAEVDPAALVQAELAALLYDDQLHYPVEVPSAKGKKSKKRQKKRAHRPLPDGYAYEEFDASLLERARLLLNDQVEELLAEAGCELPTPGSAALEQLVAAQRELSERYTFVPSTGAYRAKSSLSAVESGESADHQYRAMAQLQRQHCEQVARLAKLTQVYCGGYQKRSEALSQELAQLYAQVDSSEIELACFRERLRCESEALPGRLARTRRETALEEEKEKELQDRYRVLQSELETLEASL